MQSLATRSYAEFAQIQLQERLHAQLPPFSHLCLLRAEAGDMKTAVQFLDQLAAYSLRFSSKNALAIDQLGPLPAPMEKRAGKYRVQLLLKSKKRCTLQALLSQLCLQLEQMKFPRSLRFSIDVDPQELI